MWTNVVTKSCEQQLPWTTVENRNREIETAKKPSPKRIETATDTATKTATKNCRPPKLGWPQKRRIPQ